MIKGIVIPMFRHRGPSCPYISAHPEYFNNFDVWYCSLPEWIRFFITVVIAILAFCVIIPAFLKFARRELSI